MSSFQLILLADGLLLLAAGAFGSAGRSAVSLSILGAAVLLMFVQWILFDSLWSTGQSVRVERHVKQPHYVQGLLQTCLYLYWGLYWDGVWAYAPLILVQLVFAYALDMWFSWLRQRVWRVGFGPVPIVLSINLFLWFKESYFVLSFVLIALTYLGKEFIRWNRGGQRVHIFNPSAFSLACVSLLLLATRSLHVTRGVDIIESFNLPPNMYEVIFLLGLVVQLLFATTLVSLGALSSLFLLHSLAAAVLGVPLSPVPIEISVLLGLTLLVTDPSTSPRTKTGRLLFGLAYGSGTFILFILLRLTHQPAFVDKILMVPVVNLLVPLFDRAGEAFERTVERAGWKRTVPYARFLWVGVYAALFVSILPAFKRPHLLPPNTRAVLPPSAVSASPQVTRQLGNMLDCRRLLPQAYVPFGFPGEIPNCGEIREIYRDGLDRYLQQNPSRAMPRSGAP